MLESVQPCNRPTSQSGLLRLAALDNQDKHRGIRVVAVSPRDADHRFAEDVAGRGTLRFHADDTTKPDRIVAIELDEPRRQPTVSELLLHLTTEVWAVKAILEQAIDATRPTESGLTNGMWQPEGKRWVGRARQILCSDTSTEGDGLDG